MIEIKVTKDQAKFLLEILSARAMKIKTIEKAQKLGDAAGSKPFPAIKKYFESEVANKQMVEDLTDIIVQKL